PRRRGPHGHSQEGGADHACSDGARMVAARSGPHPPGRGAGARAQISGGRRTARKFLRPKTMNILTILFALAAAAPLSAQTFIQMSDPQFGMFNKDAS